MANTTYNFIDLTGQIFSALEVISRDNNKKGSHWICRCTNCGTIKSFRSQKLRLGKSKSCGCLRGKHCSEANTIHGHHRRGVKVSPEYKSWCHMRSRCKNPKDKNYHLYGGRGITYDLRWDDFGCFLMDVGYRPAPGYTIDRINNNGNYELGNVRWATKKEQSMNRRSNVIIIHNEVNKILSQWAEDLGIHYSTLRKRLKTGWFLISTPIKRFD